MSLVVVSYAINGRGMGHLTRQLAILRWVRRIGLALDQKVECWVLTSSEADTLARREGFCSLKMPSKAMMRDAGIEPARYLRIARGWVLNTMAALAPDLLLVDTFPGGSFGELTSTLELARRRVLVARKVRPEFADQPGYQALLPLYQRVIVPDPSDVGPILIRGREEVLDRDEARRRLGVSRRTVYVSLGGGGDASAPSVLPRLVRQLSQSWDVVVGAGPLYDGAELRGPGVTWMDRYVPVELFSGLDAAVSAGGYNSFHELMHLGVPTVFLPQPRIADDQLLRAQQAVRAGAGRLARSVAEVAELLEQPGSAQAARDLVPVNGAKAAALAALEGLLPPQDLAHADTLLDAEFVQVLDRAGLELVQLLGGARPATEFLTLCERVDAGEAGLPLLRSLARKFPAATPEERIAAAETLFTQWSRFDDWMGAVSLLRAVPTQRSYPLAHFARDMGAWLEGQEDLFDALREFTQLEGHGKQPVAAVLHQLRQGP
mgnify:CR=1 FL=1